MPRKHVNARKRHRGPSSAAWLNARFGVSSKKEAQKVKRLLHARNVARAAVELLDDAA